jgi:hypothetical protein
MAVTAQNVFRAAMTLMDELDELTGNEDTDDTLEYKNRTLPILNILLNLLTPYSTGQTNSVVNVRTIGTPITDYITAIPLDDFIAGSIMPYGLAYHLIIEENPQMANTFLQLYQEHLREYAAYQHADSEDIDDLYGGIESPCYYNN